MAPAECAARGCPSVVRAMKRAKRLKARWFGSTNPATHATADVPELKPEARAERVAFDASGRMALEALVRDLPWEQAEKLCGGALSAAPFVAARRTSKMSRRDLHEVKFPTHDRHGMMTAAAAIVADVAHSGWFRRLVSAAVGHWTLARRMSRAERRACTSSRASASRR